MLCPPCSTVMPTGCQSSTTATAVAIWAASPCPPSTPPPGWPLRVRDGEVAVGQRAQRVVRVQAEVLAPALLRPGPGLVRSGLVEVDHVPAVVDTHQPEPARVLLHRAQLDEGHARRDDRRRPLVAVGVAAVDTHHRRS